MKQESRTAISQVADSIRDSRHMRGWTTRQLADACGCSVKLVEQWEAGETVPDGQRWKRLCGCLDRGLFRLGPLHRDALAELAQIDAARKAKIGTSLDAKLRAAISVSAPELGDPPLPPKAPEPIQLPPPEITHHEQPIDPTAKSNKETLMTTKQDTDSRGLPAGWRSQERVNERRDYARLLFEEDPKRTPSDVHALLIEEFKVGIRYETLAEIHDEVQRAQKQREKLGRPLPKLPAPKAQTIEQALQSAAEILLDAVPNLASYQLTVAEDGKVSIDYEVRVVKGSLTITR